MIFPWQADAWEELNRLRARLPHALLIPAREGMGAFEFALAFAQALLCEAPLANGLGCGACAACNWFSLGNHPDFRLVQPEALTAVSQPAGEEEEPRKDKEKASKQIKIEQSRDLQDFLGVGTHRAGLRVILLHPAEAMNPNTQNALLKNLEEPPPGTVFVLVSYRAERLLPTVRSRCMKFPLPVPDPAIAVQWLKEQGIARPEAVLASAGGAPLIALQLAGSEAERQGFLARLREPDFDPIRLGEQCARLAPAEVVTWLQRWSYDLLSARLGGRIRYHAADERAVAAIAGRLRASEVAAYLRVLAQARALAHHPLNPKLFFEDLFLQYGKMTRN